MTMMMYSSTNGSNKHLLTKRWKTNIEKKDEQQEKCVYKYKVKKEKKDSKFVPTWVNVKPTIFILQMIHSKQIEFVISTTHSFTLSESFLFQQKKNKHIYIHDKKLILNKYFNKRNIWQESKKWKIVKSNSIVVGIYWWFSTSFSIQFRMQNLI